MGRLADNAREALSLYYVNGLTYGQISTFLSISQGTLKGRLQRGCAQLRQESAMLGRVFRGNAPDDAFARRLDRAVGVLAAKGPPTDHLPSPWHSSFFEESRRIRESGEEGLRVDVALSHAGQRRLRWAAVLDFRLRGDEASLHELERMLEHPSARTRAHAVVWYAFRIHPPKLHHPSEATRPTSVNPPRQLECLLRRMADENFNVRLRSVQVVGAYASSGDDQVRQALQKALDDPKHKVRSYAARVLRVPCRGCCK